ncbi:MAG: hypothetical protein QOJ11_2990 [Frankiales bacterium]|nr:hypothetical protein [Frankiales bacterium]
MKIFRLFAVSALMVAAVSLPSPTALASGGAGGWITICPYDHSLADDPILFPGQPGVSHLHDYLGNKSANASSTYTSMEAAGTTCGTAADKAGYWTPALYKSGAKVLAKGFYASGGATRNTFYYRTSNVLSSYHVTAFPANFRMVAGNSHATSEADNPYLGREIYWGCSNNSPDVKSKVPINCPTGAISLHVGFPNCWDGVIAPNETSHLRYPSSYVCPSGYGTVLPRVIFRLEYPVGTSSASISLSSGPYYTAHADFWNTWDQPGLQRLVDRCLNAHVDCGNNPVP